MRKITVVSILTLTAFLFAGCAGVMTFRNPNKTKEAKIAGGAKASAIKTARETRTVLIL